jgi:aerobic-type carbon monoxide dehydrogenase small subunit (CoxS/CutS family)
MSISLLVNGSSHEVEDAPDQNLLTVLRDTLSLTGTKYGCGEGQCGACTILLDGKPARSCRTSLKAAQGKAITTIEGLEHDGKLHVVQRAFLNQEAFQCGYCTPGMILSAVALLQVNARPNDADIIRFMNGNICRCGTYPRILAAVHEAAGTSSENR